MKRLLVSIALSAALLVSGAYAQTPAGSTAMCGDGSYSHAATEKGACSHHGGVKTWFGSSNTAVAPTAPMPTATRTASAAPSSPMAGASAMCGDGSYSHAASAKGACSHHGGVKTWYGNSTATVATPAMTPAPLPAPTPTPQSSRMPSTMPTQPATRGGNGLVWVNTRSKVYHCSGDRWYGKTKAGAYMTEGDAKAKGNRPDHGKACM